MIVFKDVVKSYARREVLSGVSFSLSAGERGAIAGASGCGKTTVLRLAAGLEKPDSGKIECGKCSFVFQEERLFPSLTALENVSVVKSSGNDSAKELLCSLGMENDLGKKPAELSGGMRQRVALARALYFDSEVLLLDEPFKQLDPDIAALSAEITLEYLKGRTLLVVTHDISESTSLGCNLFHLIDGKISRD